LSFRMHDRTQAAQDWAQAEALATNAGDQNLRAFALTSRSNLYSATWNPGQSTNTTLALTLLDAAHAATDEQTPPILRAWLLARRAEEHASRADANSTHADMELCARSFSNIQGPLVGFFSEWDDAQLM